MKTNFTFLTLLLAAVGLAQAPVNYYNGATGTGYTLKTNLKNIVTTGHNSKSYDNLWGFYSASQKDNYYEHDNTVLDIYSENPSGSDPYTYSAPGDQCGNYNAEGQCYNREHLIPKSYFSDATPMHNDAHHVVPSDGKVNGWRGNLPFGVVGVTATAPCNSGANNTPCHSANNSRLGNNLDSGYSAGFSGKVFEPIDEFKGDIARTYFYFATRYQDQMAQFYTTATNTEVKVMFDGSANKVFNDTFLNILLTWHNSDPVSAKEIAINNAVYNYQGNRNPFIDHPEYVSAIWGVPMGTSDYVLEGVTVYPNPASNGQVNIYSETQLDEIQLININGQIVQKIRRPILNNNTITLQNLPQGFYILKLSSGEGSAAKKIIVN
jgi:endonuclease I